MPAGDMKLCLDNTFSRFSNKLVFFEIISDDKRRNCLSGTVNLQFFFSFLEG